MGVRLHLSEVKGPVMDRLEGTEFLAHLSGRVHLSQHQAVQAIVRGASPAPDKPKAPASVATTVG